MRLTRQDIASKLNPKSLKTTQTIQFALIMGLVLFFGVCMILKFVTPQDRLPGDEPEFEMLLPIIGLMFFAMLVATTLIPNLMLKPQSLARRAESIAGDPVEWSVLIHRTVVIIRLAMYGGVALFGLVVLMLSVMSNRLDDHPIVWLAALPLLVHVGYGIISFPNKTTVVDFIDARIVGPLRRHSG